jgi:hypothetical protein
MAAIAHTGTKARLATPAGDACTLGSLLRQERNRWGVDWPYHAGVQASDASRHRRDDGGAATLPRRKDNDEGAGVACRVPWS